MDNFWEQERLLIGVATLFYGVAFLFGFVKLIRGRRYARWILYALILVGLVFHTFGLYQRGLETEGVPLRNPFEFLQFITWSIVFLYLLVGPPERINLLGFFAAGMASLLSLVALLIPQWDYAHAPGVFRENPWIEMHALLALFSYGVFAVLTLVSAMYLIQNYGLLYKRSQSLFSFLPSINLLSRMGERLLAIGVVVLTLAIVLGWVNQLIHAESILSFKILTTSFVWAGYLALFILRRKNKLIANQFACACMVLFVFALCTLIPVTQKIDARRSSNAVPFQSETEGHAE